MCFMNINPFSYTELIRKEFLSASDRATAIVGGSFVDELLTLLLKDFFVADPENDKKLFSGSGSLATFAAKIDMAFRLGLISKSEHKSLHYIRSIRNVFAHQLGDATFSNQSIIDKCRNISVPYDMLVPDFVEPLDNGDFPEIHAPAKVDEGDARALFQESISHHMRVLAARNMLAKESSRSSPEDFRAAQEPITIVLNEMKKIEKETIATIELAKSLGSRQIDATIVSMAEYHHIVCKTEMFIEQIRASHEK